MFLQIVGMIFLFLFGSVCIVAGIGMILTLSMFGGGSENWIGIIQVIVGLVAYFLCYFFSPFTISIVSS